jgi:membrane fusion protein, multidrug efflux system
MPTPPPSDPGDAPLSRDTMPQPAPPPRRKLSRRASVIGTALALVVAAGLAWLAWDLTRPEQLSAVQRGTGAGARPGGGGAAGPGGAAGARAATTVGFAVAEAGDIPVNLEALGTVTPQATVRVRPQVSGVLTQVLFKEGQNVKKGQLLATIDPRPFEMALQQALGQRMRDEAQLAAARVTLERFETLLKQDSIARQEVDTQRASVNQLAATVVASKANEGTAALNLSYARILAPIEGRVGLRNVDVGNQVGTSDTNGIAVITQMSPMDVEFAIPQDHAAFLQNNAAAFMEVKAFDRTRTELLDTGVFASLDNQIDTQTGTVRAKARFNNARQQLFPSQFVNVQLRIRTIQKAVVVPVAAVRQSGGGEYVFVLLDDRTVKLRPVVRGQPVGDRVQVASGLQIGEKVITEGADRLRDGARVMLPGDTPRGAGGQGGGRRQRDGASAPSALPAASDALTGASAAHAPSPRREATAPFAGASASMGADGGGAGASLTPEERAARAAALAKLTPEERAARAAAYEKLTPEEREARRQQWRAARQAASGASPAQ